MTFPHFPLGRSRPSSAWKNRWKIARVLIRDGLVHLFHLTLPPLRPFLLFFLLSPIFPPLFLPSPSPVLAFFFFPPSSPVFSPVSTFFRFAAPMLRAMHQVASASFLVFSRFTVSRRDTESFRVIWSREGRRQEDGTDVNIPFSLSLSLVSFFRLWSMVDAGEVSFGG